MGRWMQEEGPEQGPEQQRAEQPQAYNGPWTEKYYRITIYMTVSRVDIEPFPAIYAIVVPDYNMDAVQDTLNSNGVSYHVEPIEGGGDSVESINQD